MAAIAANDLLDALLHDWRHLLQGWSADGRLTAAAQEALMLDGEHKALTDLVGQWATGDFSAIPPIVLLSSGDISGAMGAYAISTGKIYLNADWLAAASREQAFAVLTEELGHHLDGLLNAVDTPGDEGELMAKFLLDACISDDQRNHLINEDDHIVITDKDRLSAEASGDPSFIGTFGTSGADYSNGLSSTDGVYLYVPASFSSSEFILKIAPNGSQVAKWALGPTTSTISTTSYSNGFLYVATTGDDNNPSRLYKFSRSGGIVWARDLDGISKKITFVVEGGGVLYTGGYIDYPGVFNPSNTAFIEAKEIATGNTIYSKSYSNQGLGAFWMLSITTDLFIFLELLMGELTMITR